MKQKPSSVRKRLRQVYEKLLAQYGAQNWWPHESKWEIMVGAILTQNTSWKNVEKALANLKSEKALAPARLREQELERLTALIRAAGFTSSKPKRLKILAEFLLREYGDDPLNMRGGHLETQRAQLLALHGVGPETADAILLYAAEQPIFVVDAYTRRIFYRMGIWNVGVEFTPANAWYDELQKLFMANLPREVALFNEFHALLDIHAKYTCTKRAPRCEICPLKRMCQRVGVGV